VRPGAGTSQAGRPVATSAAEVLLAFYDYPAEHWIHLTNPIESTFATVRLRQRVTKRLGSRVPYVTLIASFAAL
jgi:hypothetical protein